jgi:hypothetical protein
MTDVGQEIHIGHPQIQGEVDHAAMLDDIASFSPELRHSIGGPLREAYTVQDVGLTIDGMVTSTVVKG